METVYGLCHTLVGKLSDREGLARNAAMPTTALRAMEMDLSMMRLWMWTRAFCLIAKMEVMVQGERSGRRLTLALQQILGTADESLPGSFSQQFGDHVRRSVQLRCRLLEWRRQVIGDERERKWVLFMLFYTHCDVTDGV
jgi:hypothetical protein